MNASSLFPSRRARLVAFGARFARNVVLSLLLVPLFSLGQATQTPEELAVRAGTALLNAKTENLKAEREYQATIDAPETARKAAEKAEADAKAAADKEAADKKEQKLKDTLTAISELGSKLPQGTYTAAEGGVATPKAMELAYQSLDERTTDLRGTLATVIADKTLIFVDAIPGPSAGYELKMYEKQFDDVKKRAAAALGSEPEAQVGAVAAIAALPSILNAVSGFFRVDISEKSFDAKIATATAVSSFMGKALKDYPVGTNKEKKAGKIYLSVEAYALAGADLRSLPIVVSIGELQTADDALAEALEQAPDPKEEKSAVAKAAAAVDEATTAMKNLQYQRDLAAEMAKIASANAPASNQQVADLTDRVEKLNEKIAKAKAAITPLQQGLDTAKKTLEKALEDKETMVALRAEIAKIFVALKSTEGTPPLFVRLVRDAFLAQIADKATTIRFIALNVAASTNGTLTKKTFFTQSTHGSSFVALEYRVADGTLGILEAGVVKKFDMQKLDF